MDAIPPALLAAQQQLCACFASGDAAGVAAVYAEAGQIMPTYSPTIRGRAAIQAFWQGCIDMGICTMQRIPLEVDALARTINEVVSIAFSIANSTYWMSASISSSGKSKADSGGFSAISGRVIYHLASTVGQ